MIQELFATDCFIMVTQSLQRRYTGSLPCLLVAFDLVSGYWNVVLINIRIVTRCGNRGIVLHFDINQKSTGVLPQSFISKELMVYLNEGKKGLVWNLMMWGKGSWFFMEVSVVYWEAMKKVFSSNYC